MTKLRIWLTLALSLVMAGAAAAPVGTGFTYQGELKVSGIAVTTAIDFEFALFNVATAGSAIATVTRDDVAVAAGLFTVELDYTDVPFAAAQEYFLELRVRDGASTGGYQQLLPRQKVTPAPYAVSARTVQAGGVGQGAIAAGAVGSAQLQSSAVGTTQLGNLAVTSAKIADASITQAKLAFTAGDVTAVTVGTGLTGGGVSGDLQIAVDTDVIQTRVNGTCAIGEYFRGVALDGSVVCESVLAFLGIRLTSSADGATSDVGRYSDIAISGDGFAVISYFDQNAAALKVAKCVNIACSGATITAVDDDPNSNTNSRGAYSSIAIGNDGFPVISYEQNFFSPSTLKVAKCANAACTGSAIITTVDDPPVNGVGPYTSIAVGSDGLPVISYWDINAGALKVAKCINADCTGTATITSVDDQVNNVGQYSSIAIGADSMPVVSYYDSTAGTLKVAKCTAADCTGAAIITTVHDPAQAVGQYSSIAVGADGLPAISYYDLSGQLWLAKCSTPNCTGTATVTALDGPGGGVIGRYTAIALDNDGLPVISYERVQGGADGALKVAKCANPACTGTNTTLATVDDPANQVGQYTSIAIGGDGLPVISYYDVTAGDLKVVKCGTRSCR